MIPQPIIDQILAVPILDILGKHVTVKKAGATYEACCPFHQEKTASLKIFPKTNSFKCFGCGKGGNGIGFLMEKDGVSFPEACKAIARDHGIHIPKEKMSDEEKEKFHKRESLLVLNKLVMEFFRDQLFLPENALALEYVKSRWEDDTIALFDIGWAPDSFTLVLDWAKEKGIKQDALLEAGLIRESENKPGHFYAYFRGRVIFPIKDKFGRVVGFTGRDQTGHEKAPKYLNSPDSEIYNKSETLFGIQLAAQAIRDKKFAYLVEGNADVVKMHQIDVPNTVCSSGTSLTLEQVKMLKAIYEDLSITIIFDGDPSGVKATERAAKMIIDQAIPCNVLMLPTEDGKTDPDSFFHTHDEFTEFANKGIRDYIILKAMAMADKAKAPDFKMRAIQEICDLIIHFRDSSQKLYISQVGAIIKPEKAWTDRLKELKADMEPEEEAEKIPKHVTLSDWERFGFYEDHNCYYFKTKGGIIRGCNFTLRPLFHVKSVVNAKRLFEMTNEHGAREVLELPQRDLVALARFKECVESRGNFLWEASDTELNKLKRWLYEKTESCEEIVQLGWQKQGFYAWGNGIYNGSFHKVDNFGIVQHKETNYYLPAFSDIYRGEPSLFINERRFIHRDGNSVTLQEYASRLLQVFGDNAMIALCFYFASLFRDFIIQRFTFFPILDLFGPKGAGKTELAVSLIAFFGKQGKGPNINNTSKPALADHVAQVANACIHIDEYKNNIDIEKIEFLKGLWDGTGRTRMNMEKDKKKETTAVDSGIILSGQEMPTADIALFSRLVYLTFNKTEYSDEEKIHFNELKEIEKKGLTHITNELLSLREHFTTHYPTYYDQAARDITAKLEGVVIEDRIFRNWLLIIAAFATIEDKIQVPFTYSRVIELASVQIRYQNQETKKSNEVSTFWNIVEYLNSDGLIQDQMDYKVILESDIKTDLVDRIFEEPKTILYVQMTRIMQLYRKHGKNAGEKVLPVDSIDYYLRTDNRYLGKKKVRFRYMEGDGSMSPTSKPMWAYAFQFDELNLSLSGDISIEPKKAPVVIVKENPDGEELPF